MTAGEIKTVADLERELARPSEEDIACMRRLDGDILILGAGGKMGPSLARLCRNASDAAGTPRRIFAVVAEHHGGTRHRRDSLAICSTASRSARLPDCPNVLYLAGRKFGSSGNPELTWAMNTVVPAIVAERFRGARIVAFSTGQRVSVPRGGERRRRWNPTRPRRSASTRSRAWDANASSSTSRDATGRRACCFASTMPLICATASWWTSRAKSTRERRSRSAVPAFNVIWQRDANSYALRSLEYCATPPRILNVTGAEILRVRDVANWFAARFGRECKFQGNEGATALLSDASALLSTDGHAGGDSRATDGDGGRLG